MIKNRIMLGDNTEILKTLPDNSVDCCVTSPPYYLMRNYGGIEGQIGLEPTPEDYVEKLVSVFREVKRVLKDSGTLWVIIGDSYAGSRKGGHSGKHKYLDNEVSRGVYVNETM
ncbi:MAG: site-specific DNA-methyltransferase, partial [Treponema sp.]|nr:site-specific DNA-methyltransferase [Treponema sp.]